MPRGGAPDDGVDGVPPKLGLWERFQLAVLKPADPDAPAKPAPEPKSVEELEASVKSTDDKERLIGLLAAPVGAALGIVVINALIANDPASYLRNGQVNKLHVSISLYHELLLVLLGLSLLMLVMAWLRKRLFLGIVLALYGLAVFNLHYWGFGIPFIMVGAWMLVRTYRLQRELREAGGTTRPARGGAAAPGLSRPQPNKRYTPKTSSSKRPPPPKPEDQQKAG